MHSDNLLSCISMLSSVEKRYIVAAASQDHCGNPMGSFREVLSNVPGAQQALCSMYLAPRIPKSENIRNAAIQRCLKWESHAKRCSYGGHREF